MKYSHHTRHAYLNGVRRILRYLWEHYGAEKLDNRVRKVPGLRPRNVTVTDAERQHLLAVAEPHMRLLILLCSDMAIRSGTAVKLGPDHYDPARKTLTFTTKFGERLTLPTTDEIDRLIMDCQLHDSRPFVIQLWHHSKWMRGRERFSDNPANQLRTAFRKLCLAHGITRPIKLHDLRRTTAVAMLQHSGDVRDVQALLGHRSLQATIWYLDHNLRPIQRQTLEALKKPYLVPKEKTA